MENAWEIHGYVWKVFGKCVDMCANVGKMHGTCMENVWKMYGKCVEDV